MRLGVTLPTPRRPPPTANALPGPDKGAPERQSVRIPLPPHAPLTALVLAQFYDVDFYPYTAPGLDPVFAVCGGPFVGPSSSRLLHPALLIRLGCRVPLPPRQEQRH